MKKLIKQKIQISDGKLSVFQVEKKFTPPKKASKRKNWLSKMNRKGGWKPPIW